MKRVGELLSAFVGEHFSGEFLEKSRQYSRFYSSWEAILRANQIAAAADHSRINELDKQMVSVEADHPGWVQILQTKQAEILAALQRRFPEFNIRGISFRYASPPFKPDPTTKPPLQEPAPAQASPPEADRERALPAIADPELADALRRWRQATIDRERAQGKPQGEPGPL